MKKTSKFTKQTAINGSITKADIAASRLLSFRYFPYFGREEFNNILFSAEEWGVDDSRFFENVGRYD